MAPPAACKCGAEEQTLQHVITFCPIYHYPKGACAHSAVDNRLVPWLTATCPTCLRKMFSGLPSEHLPQTKNKMKTEQQAVAVLEVVVRCDFQYKQLLYYLTKNNHT